MASQQHSGRAASMARRRAQVSGKAALTSTTASRSSAASSSTPSRTSAVPASSGNLVSSSRNASLARRKAMSTRGKAGYQSSDRQRTGDMMRTRLAESEGSKKDCGCGCNGAGDCGDKKVAVSAAPSQASAKPRSGARRAKPAVQQASTGRINSRARRQLLSKQGKSGLDALRKGGLSSAQIVRTQNPEISGRELARSVRTLRSANGSRGATSSAPTGRQRPAKPAEGVTGTKVSHSHKTTGDLVGLCRSVTGTDYLSGEVFNEFCQTQAPASPRKVEITSTSRGNTVTSGGKVGSSSKVTGNEPGSCRNVTGNEYLGSEHFDKYCNTKIQPGNAKVSFSKTTRGQIISGSKPARSGLVTGDEPGTCKAVTGTPYAGMDQFDKYCGTRDASLAKARTARAGNNVGREISGIQPGLQKLTGAEKGACDLVTGTPYLGAGEQKQVCGTTPAQMGESDFPQAIADAPWGTFSVIPPSHASQAQTKESAVTGSRYEQGKISGTFSMGEGKVTGTEQFRFGNKPAVEAQSQKEIGGKPVGRITGEGIDTGLKITGDDWDRGDRVTGTEGMSAVKRNPSRRGPMSAMAPVTNKRNEELGISESKVTGSSGNTEKGAPITVSGGARG